MKNKFWNTFVRKKQYNYLTNNSKVYECKNIFEYWSHAASCLWRRNKSELWLYPDRPGSQNRSGCWRGEKAKKRRERRWWALPTPSWAVDVLHKIFLAQCSNNFWPIYWSVFCQKCWKNADKVTSFKVFIGPKSNCLEFKKDKKLSEVWNGKDVLLVILGVTNFQLTICC